MTRTAVPRGLVAYNEERYIRAAIEEAFAQDFSPMEILLSDDCSPDGTFAIMQEMATAYRGPHVVRVRREPQNVRLVQLMINLAQRGGELLVVAAGDDISYSERASALHSAWAKIGAAALVSKCDEIDEDGAVARRDATDPPNDIVQMIYGAETQAHLVDGKIGSVFGCCAAFRRTSWPDLPYPPVSLMLEDGSTGALITMRSEIITRMPQRLMAYRVLTASLTIRRAGLRVADIRTTEQPRNRNTAWSLQMRFDMICEANDNEHRFTKPNHPWTKGQVERMNRTIKEATGKRFEVAP